MGEKLKLSRGNRFVVNGAERAYHGQLGSEEHDFVRLIPRKGIEYISFSNLKVNPQGGLTGKVVSVYIAKLLSGFNSCCGEDSVDLYSRGMKIWEMNPRGFA